jgi:transposase
MEPYPKRLRMRIIELYQQGKPTKEIAAALGTCCSGTRRVRQYQRERQTLEPLRGKTGPKSGLNEQLGEQLREAVAADPDATGAELRQRLNINKDVRTVGRWLGQLGLVLKKSRCTPPSRTGRT